MRILDIAGKDLLILYKDRGTVLQLFVLPLIFIVVLTGALSAVSADHEQDTRIRLVVVDLDGGEMAQRFLAVLHTADNVRVELYAYEEAIGLVWERKLPRVLIIPAGFTADLDADRVATLQLINHPDANVAQTEAVRLVIEGAVQEMTSQYQILTSLEQMTILEASAPEECRIFTEERISTQTQAQFEHLHDHRLINVVERTPQVTERPMSRSSEPVQLAVPGFTVLFVFLTAQTTARSVYEEKKVGSFRRLLAAPLSRAALLAGKIIPNFITALIQTVVIFAFGLFGLPQMGLTPLTLGNAPGAIFLIAVTTALCSSSLGVLIAALARTDHQIGGLSSLILWGAGILGGSFIPLSMLERLLGSLPRAVPHYWANRAFENLLIRGLSPLSVLPELAGLLAFTALFFAIGLWRFRFD